MWIDDWVKVEEEIVESLWGIEKILEGKSGIGIKPTQIKNWWFQTLPTFSLYSVSFKMKLW